MSQTHALGNQSRVVSETYKTLKSHEESVLCLGGTKMSSDGDCVPVCDSQIKAEGLRNAKKPHCAPKQGNFPHGNFGSRLPEC